MATSPENKRELEEFLRRGKRTQMRIVQPRKSAALMQHNLARNLLIGFLVLIIVILLAVQLYNAAFCREVKECGENFVNVKIVVDTLLDFGSPFIGIIIGFFFSEKFRGDTKGE